VKRLALVALGLVWATATSVTAQTAMDRRLDAKLDECSAIQKRVFAAGDEARAKNDTSLSEYLPLQAAWRACMAEYNRMQAVADGEPPPRESGYQEPQFSSGPEPTHYQPPPAPQEPPAQAPFDPGYTRQPAAPVVCAGQVVVMGPPDQPDACAR